MKLREKTNKEICENNDLKFQIMSNVVEENVAKSKMRATSDLIAKALIATLGPYGTSTIIQDRDRHHFATKDGYDLMNRITFDDEVARTILDLFRTTASSQVLTVGDGSTSAIVVANALFQALTDKNQLEHFKKIAPKDIIDILNDISEIVEEELKKMAKPISSDMHELDIIAAIANNNDKDAGKLIADIYRTIGEHGFITMDVHEKRVKDEFEIKSGIEWNRGYVDSIYGMGYENEKVIYESNPRIILSSTPITYSDVETIMVTLLKTACNQEGAEVLIVANDFDQDTLTFFKSNRTKHLRIGSKDVPMNFTVVDIDQVTAEGKNKIQDLALLCGCKVYNKFTVKPAEVIAHPEDFIGHAEKVVVSKKVTQVVISKELPDDITKAVNSRIKEISESIKKLTQVEEPTMDQDLELYEYKRRLSNLTSSTAILHVGGRTLAERMTRQRLIEDAVFACKSALKYGYIPGGNICIPKVLIEKREAIADYLGTKYKYLPIENIRVFFLYFIDMLKEAFLESYRAVLNNSYLTETETEETIEKCLSENLFYNLKEHKFEHWDETGVINSVNTDIQILNSCISIIGILSTSNQFITINLNVMDLVEKK